MQTPHTGIDNAARGDFQDTMETEELSLEEQVERIRRKRARRFDSTKARTVLNTVFLVMAAVGLVMYFFGSENHQAALIVIAVGMAFKVVEFILRIIRA